MYDRDRIFVVDRDTGQFTGEDVDTGACTYVPNGTLVFIRSWEPGYSTKVVYNISPVFYPEVICKRCTPKGLSTDTKGIDWDDSQKTAIILFNQKGLQD